MTMTTTSLAALTHAPAGVPSSRVAVIDRARSLTWTELDAHSLDAARALASFGLDRGDRVAIQFGTCSEFVVLYFGALRAGLIVVPINPTYTTVELAYVLNDSGAKLLVTESIIPSAATLPLHVERVVSASAPQAETSPGDSAKTLEQFLALGRTIPAPGAELARTGEEIAVILYTSGTSGHPKGAMLSARALAANVDQVAAVEPPIIFADDTVFIPLPLFHIYGLNAGLGVALRCGATVVLADRFSASASLAEIARSGATVVLGAPGMFVQWATHPDLVSGFANVRFALSGAAPLSVSLAERYTQMGITLYEGYGLTETAPCLTLTAVGADNGAHAGTVGRPVPGVEIQLRNSDGSEVAAEDEDPGQLFVRGPNLFSGYWPDGAGGPDEEGWFATGDIAILDKGGYLRLVGRTSDLIIVNGFNVYPAEVERVLSEAVGVAEVAVLGVTDERTGEAVVAFVVASPEMNLDVEELQAHAARSLAKFKLPRSIHFVDALPHTPTGKVQKWRLKDKLAG